MARAGHLSRISIAKTSPQGLQMGLRTDSVVLTDNLATVLEREVLRNLGHMTDMAPVDVAMRHTLGLD